MRLLCIDHPIKYTNFTLSIPISFHTERERERESSERYKKREYFGFTFLDLEERLVERLLILPLEHLRSHSPTKQKTYTAG